MVIALNYYVLFVFSSDQVLICNKGEKRQKKNCYFKYPKSLRQTFSNL